MRELTIDADVPIAVHRRGITGRRVTPGQIVGSLLRRQAGQPIDPTGRWYAVQADGSRALGYAGAISP